MTDLSSDGALLIEPRPTAWGELIAAHRDSLDWARAAVFRRELGLDDAGVNIMSGHQAGFWHAGIVAKYIATSTAGRALGANGYWLVADLDDKDPTKLAVPVRDEGGGWVVREVELLEVAVRRHGVATGSRAPLPATRALPAGVPKGVNEAVAALRESRAGASTLADQVHAASESMLQAFGIDSVPWFAASAMSRTTLFREISERMLRDPRSCVEAYNQAVQAQSDAGVRALSAREGRYELPVWDVQPEQPRGVVFACGSDMVEVERWVPRGLLMTGLMRLAGCDLFIHGTGGAAYDKITERWFELWLGERRLAPVAMVSATRLVDLGVEVLSEREAARVVARGHRARHDPALVGEYEAEHRKREILKEIERLPRKTRARLEAYAQLHKLLEAVQRSRATEIERFERAAEHVRASGPAQAMVRDRTWSYVLHTPKTLKTLRTQIEDAFAVGSVHRADD